MNQLHLFQQPIVFAHRGASGYAPENTLAAFKKAVELKADAIELDVKLCGDGTPVVIHDQTLDRTTNGQGDVRGFTLEQLKKYDAGSKFDPRFHEETIPTLAEVFETVGRKIYINIELTNYKSTKDGLAEAVIKLIDDYQLDDQVMFSSFLPGNILKVRRLKPQIPAAILCLPGLKGGLTRGLLGRWISPEAVHPYYTDVNEAYMQGESARKRLVNVWTPNATNDFKQLLQWGVNGIITDYPDLVLDLRGQK